MPQRDQIIAWVTDAHAMEQGMAAVLQQHIKDAQAFPDIRDRLQQHLDESRRHAQRLEAALSDLEASPSTLKSVGGRAFGMIEGMATVAFRDGLVKNAIVDYAMEHFEMGCYSALASAAKDAGMTQLAQMGHEIFGQEAEMAEWWEELIPEITRLHLHTTAVA